FKKILIVSGHGGTTHNLAMMEIVSKFPEAEYFVAHELISEKVLKKIIESENDWHSGEHETSEMLFLAPELVDMKKAIKENPKFPEKVSSPKEYMKANPSGVNGNPLKATKAKGKKLFEAAVKGLIEKIKK
ncbi:MAG: creatininase family protein, partial [Candidatus Diapherotrites archaeon]|nr:creatininase family protein [Candidatus Diapherotrites archaeon]